VRVEERVAPADGGPKRSLPDWQVAIAGGEEVQGVVEAVEQDRGLEDAHARGGQLQGERPGASGIARAVASVGSTSAASVTEASETNAEPAARSPARRLKSSIAKRVLPVPP
jgi:hypothetical protein